MTTSPRRTCCFNPRAHEGRDFRHVGKGGRHLVSIHAPTRGATLQKPLKRPTPRSFNPRAHEGRDNNISEGRGLDRLVSIHAPTRGATYGTGRPAARLPVSIHAPTRGATRAPRRCRGTGCCFNPRAHEGRDGATTPSGSWPRCFNPRAHEGRDKGSGGKTDTVNGFNPRAHEGRDVDGQMGHGTVRGFNPRAHEGRDRFVSAALPLRNSFNPRAHEGRDVAAQALYLVVGVSIHAPTRGATCLACCPFQRLKFQSTRPRGARHVRDRLRQVE